MIKLRGHHLLCMLTYIGRGYSETFTRNYDALAQRISSGERLEIVAGPDDICSPLLCEAGAHCYGRSVSARDERALVVVSAVLSSSIAVGSSISLEAEMLAKLRRAYTDGQMRKACFGCEWVSLCRKVAQADYSDAKIMCAAP